MTIDRMKAVVNNRRTTNLGLECLYYSEELPVELIAQMARHENIESELLGAIFNNDGANPEVALAVASRVAILTFYPLREVACAIRDNSFKWNREEQQKIFEAFRDNLPQEGYHAYGHWRTSSFEEICQLLDEDEDEFDEDDDEFIDDDEFDDDVDCDNSENVAGYPNPEFDTSIDYEEDEFDE